MCMIDAYSVRECVFPLFKTYLADSDSKHAKAGKYYTQGDAV